MAIFQRLGSTGEEEMHIENLNKEKWQTLLHRFAEAVDMELCKWMAQIRTLLCLEISGKEHEKWVVVFLLVDL